MAGKRYFWLKLHEDFFDEKYIRALRRLPQGDSLVVVYLKMQLKTLKTEGIFHYEKIMPDCAAEFALAIDEDENITKLTLDALIKFGAIERMDNNDLYMLAMQEAIGSEGSSAKRVRDYRRRKSDEALQCNSTPLLCNGELELEKELELELDKEIDKPSAKRSTPTRHKYGEYQNVLLSDEDIEKLKTEYPGIYEEYVEKLSAYMASTGKAYKNHLATLRNWIRKDGKFESNKSDSTAQRAANPNSGLLL